MTDSNASILELREARPIFEQGGLTSSQYDLRLMPGECALVACRDPARAARFAEMCCGMIPLADGQVTCMGLDWSRLNDRRIWALRGRIGRITAQDSWIDLFGTDLNVLFRELHHTRTPTDVLVNEAVRLAQVFGLPGLPTLPPSRLTRLDRQRAGCVRAFLGSPRLLLLEEPVDTDAVGMMVAFLAELTRARQRGCAVVWFSREPSLWSAYRDADVQRFRLLDEGLFPVRQNS